MRKLTYKHGKTVCKISDINNVGDKRLLYWTQSGKELKPGEIFEVKENTIIVFDGHENIRVKPMDCISFDALKDSDFNLLHIANITKDEYAQKIMHEMHNDMDWADLVGISNGFGYTYIIVTNI